MIFRLISLTLFETLAFDEVFSLYYKIAILQCICKIITLLEVTTSLSFLFNAH